MKFFFLLFILSSCGFFIYEDQIDLTQVARVKKQVKTHCQNEKLSLEFLGGDADLQKTFIGFIQSRNQYSQAEIFVLWGLVQMRLRPDLSSPTAKLQILSQIKGKPQYHSYHLYDRREKIRYLKKQGLLKGKKDSHLTNDELKYPYLYALDQLLKKHRSRYRLADLAKHLDENLHFTFRVGLQLANYLRENQKQIKSSSVLWKYFSKGHEILQFKEALPQMEFLDIVRTFPLEDSPQHIYGIDEQTYLFHKIIDAQKEKRIACNFDLSLYENSIYLINPQVYPSHFFGVQFADGSSFMATTSQNVSADQPLFNTPFFMGKTDVRSANLCFIENKSPQNSFYLSLLSAESRDPAQHIYHLLKYAPFSLESVAELDQLISFSRHMFLNNPLRLIVESNRASSKQLQSLLELELPIYHAKRLGRLTGQIYFPSRQKAGLVLDERDENNLYCSSDTHD